MPDPKWALKGSPPSVWNNWNKDSRAFYDAWNRNKNLPKPLVPPTVPTTPYGDNDAWRAFLQKAVIWEFGIGESIQLSRL